MRRPVPVAGAAVVLALTTLTACGSSGAADDAPIAQQSIADQTKALKTSLLSQEDIESTPAGSPQRAFLEFWSDVQYGDMRQAVLAFDPALVRVVRAERLTSALRNAGSLYRAAPPEVDRTFERDGVTVIRYFAPTQSAGGTAAPLSVSLERLGGDWEIVYSSALDSELRVALQGETQDSIEPGAKELASEAAAAGHAAAGLQSTYLAEREDLVAAPER